MEPALWSGDSHRFEAKAAMVWSVTPGRPSEFLPLPHIPHGAPEIGEAGGPTSDLAYVSGNIA